MRPVSIRSVLSQIGFVHDDDPRGRAGTDFLQHVVNDRHSAPPPAEELASTTLQQHRRSNALPRSVALNASISIWATDDNPTVSTSITFIPSGSLSRRIVGSSCRERIGNLDAASVKRVIKVDLPEFV